MFKKIKEGLSKTRQIFSKVAGFFGGGRVTEEPLNQLEAKLIQADVGVHATTDIVESVRQAHLNRELSHDEFEAFLKKQLKALFPEPADLCFAPVKPTVILVAGINGSGKTTSIAKLAY